MIGSNQTTVSPFSAFHSLNPPFSAFHDLRKPIARIVARNKAQNPRSIYAAVRSVIYNSPFSSSFLNSSSSSFLTPLSHKAVAKPATDP